MEQSKAAPSLFKRLLQHELQRRTLKHYPQGWYRIFLLAIVVLANVAASYEGNLAPIVPLLLPFLGISSATYGLFAAITVAITAIVAVGVGPYADRFGRSIFVLMGILLTTIFVFVFANISTLPQFVAVRVLLGIVDGLTLTPIAGLIRDFSPQMGRGLAYAFWTLGPVGGPFLANGVAAWTLPLFGTWQSQIYIIGSVCTAVWVLIFSALRDLSPQLRLQVIRDESDIEKVNRQGPLQAELKPPPGMRFLIKKPRVWLQPFGIALFLPIYFTMLVYGPLFFSEAYAVSVQQASLLSMFFWIGTFIGLIGTGWLSDRLGLRKIVTLCGAIAAVVFNPIWIVAAMGPQTPLNVVAPFALISGLTIASAYSTWMAMFSENLEEVHPGIQATGWGVFGFAMRLMSLLVALFAPRVVAMFGGWRSWFWIAEIAMIVYLFFPFLAYGPWLSLRRRKTETASLTAGQTVGID